MSVLGRLFGSRPARIGIIVVWLVLGGLGGSFAQRFQNVQRNEESSFLPGSSESVRELTLAKRFPSGERFTAISVVRRDGGLKPQDLAAIERTRASLAANPPGPAGFSRDAVNVFASINGMLLLATAALVFVLLILIYRSPIFWVIPLFSVLMAEAVTPLFS